MPGYLVPTYRLANCCWCISLKTGSTIIGGLTAFVCSIELVSNFNKLVEVLETERTCMDTINNVNWSEAHQAYFSNCSYIKVVQFMLIIDFIIFVIGFNGSVLLIYGIKRKQPKLFLAWMVFSGMVIFSNFFSILIWHNMSIMTNVFIVIILSYSFKVVRSYHLQLYEEMNGGCPVVAVAFPPESDMRVFMPSQRPHTASDQIKDEPPPPYPGLPVVSSSLSIDSQPPPYSVVNPNYEGLPVNSEPSTSTNSQTTGLQRSSSPTNLERNLPRDASHSAYIDAPTLAMEREASGFSEAGVVVDSPSSSAPEEFSASSNQPGTPLGSGDQPNSLRMRNQAANEFSKNQSDAASQAESQSLNGPQTEDQESFKSVQSFSQSITSISEIPTEKESS